MTRFSLIAEGPTDQVVIENILCGIFNSDDLDVAYSQPTRDETDENRATSHGGWGNVLKYCASTKLGETLLFSDYVIIQIDTDRSEEEHFDVSHSENSEKLLPDELINRVIGRLIKEIEPNVYEQNRHKFIFAISVHSIECWLLPTLPTRAVHSKTRNCLWNLNDGLREGLRIDPDKTKDPKIYREISQV